MRFLAALVLLVLGVANAHHTADHELKYPEFPVSMVSRYDVTMSMTSGVPSMSPQVSKAIINMELKIYPKTDKELLIQMRKVKVSSSLASIGSTTDHLALEANNALEELLKVPSTVIFENGMITSYTLGPRETLESEKIKRTVLRNLEIYLDRQYLEGESKHYWPLTYSVNRTSSAGNYSSHYVVTSSPYADFPKELNVFNISRTDNFEVIPYLAYRTHHNFAKQGCPEVCKKSHSENRFGAGCPVQHEPHHTPMKRSFVQHHNLRNVVVQGKSPLMIDSVETKETHIADVYDQNMEVTVRTYMKLLEVKTSDKISEQPGEIVRSDMHDPAKEINEKEIEKLCKYPNTEAAIQEVKTLLNEVADIVLKDDIKEDKSKQVGEKLITIQKAMQTFKVGDFRKLQKDIKNYCDLDGVSEKEKIKRQIWVDLLPVIGTSESVDYIVYHLDANINLPNKAISLWESRSILEALPPNIHRSSEQTIKKLSMLLEILKERKTPGYTMFYSATHMAVARVISNLCAESTGIPEQNSPEEEHYSFRFLQRNLKVAEAAENEYRNNMARTCPKDAVTKFIKGIEEKLEKTTDKAKRVIYIEALTRTGLEMVLPILRKYVYGQQEQSENEVTKSPYSKLSHNYVDFLQTVTIYALHNNVEKSPRAVQELLVPVFFNKTESPKVRIAAFSAIIRSQPTLGLLQHIAEQSWKEPSEEVASYVTSSMETYGNSSQPCNQLIASRIKKVLSQLKRVDRGQHKARNNLWDLWDEVRRFGFENHYDFTPSNESFIPSVIYGSLGYNTDSLKDYFFQYASIVQGVSSRNVYDALMKRFGLTPAEDIPEVSEEAIFPELHNDMRPREPEFWRINANEQFLYSSSHYYFDEKETSLGDMLTLIKDRFKHYITMDAKGNFNGHLIKVFIPSSFHAKTISQALPYPVQFEMKNPLLISMKFKVEYQRKDGIHYDLHLSPSVYHSTIYTNEILNLRDCKKVGVYHERKIAASYPVVINLSVHSKSNYSVGYRFPKVPKNIFYYRSEAGTYAGKHSFKPLPPKEDRKTIETIPEQFEVPLSWRVPGLPRFSGKFLSENINNGMKDVPRNAEEAVHHAVKHFLNAGWRRKSVDILIGKDDTFWVPKTEMQIHLNYRRNYFLNKKSSVTNWTDGLKFDDKVEINDTCEYAAEGQKIYQILSETLNHVKDTLKVRVERRVNSEVKHKADLNLEYTHTLGGFLHFVHFNASGDLPNITKEITADYTVVFNRKPNEFKYSDKYGEQRGLAVGAISFSVSNPFENSSIVTKALFNYTKLSEILHVGAQSKRYEPETHDECLSDVQKGETLTVACIKAMREKSIYNHLKMNTVFMKEIPDYVKEIGDKIDLWLKYAYFGDMKVTRKPLCERKSDPISIHLEATYIDKMTDEPVVDVVLNKPSEIVKFSKVSVGKIRPLSSIETLAETYAAEMTNNSYPATCSLMKWRVRTYDMKTYRLPRDHPDQKCSYVLSTHCTHHKKFAVIVSQDPEVGGAQEINIYLGRDKIVLVPGTESTYKVKFNKEEKTIKPLEPHMLNETALITAVVHTVHNGGSFIEIHARKAGLKVRYNGFNVNVQVHPRYKGELCGLCSEFNGEIVREYRGVDSCLYSNANDFARSSSVGTCRQNFKALHPILCEPDSFHFSWRRRNQDKDDHQEEEEGYEPTTKRNIVLNRVSELCFSTKPVPMCNDNSEPSETESQEIDFHCLPKMDANARKMVTESKRRILGELETKPVDHTETIQVAQKC